MQLVFDKESVVESENFSVISFVLFDILAQLAIVERSHSHVRSDFVGTIVVFRWTNSHVNVQVDFYCYDAEKESKAHH